MCNFDVCLSLQKDVKQYHEAVSLNVLIGLVSDQPKKYNLVSNQPNEYNLVSDQPNEYSLANGQPNEYNLVSA